MSFITSYYVGLLIPFIFFLFRAPVVAICCDTNFDVACPMYVQVEYGQLLAVLHKSRVETLDAINVNALAQRSLSKKAALKAALEA